MDPDRLTTLYRSYGPAIYARCRLLLTDESAAEDTTQETFLRVWRRLDRVPDAREALYWIYRVAAVANGSFQTACKASPGGSDSNGSRLDWISIFPKVSS